MPDVVLGKPVLGSSLTNAYGDLVSSFQTPSGWKPWKWIRTIYTTTVDTTFGKIPYNYLPTQEIWVDAPITHCYIQLPWTLRDAFNEFLPYATTGTAMGALTGLDLAREVLEEKTIVTFGLGEYSNPTVSGGKTYMSDYPPPQLGYCIGNLLKEEIYLRMTAMKLDQVRFLGEAYEDIIYRSKFKKMYLYNGELLSVNKYTDSTNTAVAYSYVIDVGLTGKFDSSITIPTNYGINFIKKDGTNISMVIFGVTEDWKLNVKFSTTPPADQKLPEKGDYYYLNTAWCLEDPYLMDGYWAGDENELTYGGNTSGENFYLSSANKPYDEGVFTGIYITLNKDGTPILPTLGAPIADDTNVKWYFYPLTGYNKSSVYNDEKTRYRIIENLDDDGSVTTTVEEIPTATLDQVTKFLELSGKTFLRLEISGAAGPNRTNFHHPCLKNQYIKVSGSIFKILSQVDGATIDLSIKSVGGNTLSISTSSENSYAIYNEYAWFINEYYMGKERKEIFSGEVKSATVTTAATTSKNGKAKLTIKISGENAATWSDTPPIYYKPTYLDPKSFYNRFVSTKTQDTGEPWHMWKKAQNWELHVGLFIYNILSFTVDTPKPTKAGDTYNMTFEIETDYDFSSTGVIGLPSYVTFDTLFSKNGSYNGTLNVGLSQGAKEGTNGALLCVNGYWRSPQFRLNISETQYYVGICDGKYFGANDSVANKSANATIFITVPSGDSCLSSCYNDVRNTESVLYSDYDTKKLTIRQGSLDFKEYPEKIEISIGQSAYQTTAATAQNGTSITLSTSYNRLKSISFDPPSTSLDTSVLMFGIGSTENYHGFYVSGEGKVDLYGLTLIGTAAGDVLSTEYKNNNEVVSPVYSYKKGQQSALKRDSIMIGVDTSEGPIKIIGGSLSNVGLEYINNNQTIEANNIFDIQYLPHGEPIIIYEINVGNFSLKNGTTTYKNNDPDATTANDWKFSTNAIMITGSLSDEIHWGTPLTGKLDDNNQYPIMLLNSCDYMASIVDEVNNVLLIICKCYNESGERYLGAYSIPIYKLNYKTFLCEPDEGLKFLYRPPALTNTFLNDNTKTFLPVSNIIDDNFSWAVSDSSLDNFTRIMGQATTNSIITYSATDFSMVYAFKLSNGKYAILFNVENGINGIISDTSGKYWTLSAINFAQGASSAIVIDGKIVYLSQNGLKIMYTNENLLDNALSMSVGKTATDIETIQKQIDSVEIDTIYSKELRNHRFSGFISQFGIIKVFFYDLNNKLVCVEGTFKNWKIADNF